MATDDAERALLWKGRKSAFGAIAQIAPHYHLHDCVVPRTKLVEVMRGVYAIAERHGLIVTNVFHAGDGNLHPLFSFDRSVPGTLERVLQASDEVVRLCVDAGGALSGEHGIGLEKRDFMPLVFTAEDLAAQACVRAAFDPDGRMNPRKVLPDGARCGEFALAAAGSGDASADADDAAGGFMDLIASPAELRARDLRLVAKIGLATVLAWWISELLGADRPAFAAIVPLVALRADDPYGVLGVSVFRILGTVAGIAIGVASLAIDPTAPLWLVALTVGGLARGRTGGPRPRRGHQPGDRGHGRDRDLRRGRQRARLRVVPHVGDPGRRRGHDGGRRRGVAPRSDRRTAAAAGRPSRRRRRRPARPRDGPRAAAARSRSHARRAHPPLDGYRRRDAHDRSRELGPAVEPPPPRPAARAGGPGRADPPAHGRVALLALAVVVDGRRPRRRPRS